MMAQRLRLHPPLPLAAGTLARRRLVSILHPGRLCAAGSSRSSTPDALAPQARLDPPRGWRAGSAWAPALGSHCGLRGRLRLRALVGLQDSHADLLVICPSRFGQQVTLSARAPRPMSAGRTLPTPSAACAVPDLRGRLGGSNGRDARLLHARAAAARAASEGAGRPAPDEPPPRGLRVQRPQPHYDATVPQ